MCAIRITASFGSSPTFWTLKARLGLDRHHARAVHGLRARIATKLLALAASIWLNHCLGRPTQALAAFAA